MTPNRRRLCINLFALIVLLFHIIPITRVLATAGEGERKWQVYFSPRGGATDAVVQVLAQAQRSVYVQAYSFTSSPIVKALTQAHRRGVKVAVILDKSNVTDKYSAGDFLLSAGIPTFIDAAHNIAHNKTVVIDEHLVITGSFNFTRAAERDNAENLLIVDDAELAGRYLENWRLHIEHSQIYLGKERVQGHRGELKDPLPYMNLLKKMVDGARN